MGKWPGGMKWFFDCCLDLNLQKSALTIRSFLSFGFLYIPWRADPWIHRTSKLLRLDFQIQKWLNIKSTSMAVY